MPDNFRSSTLDTAEFELNKKNRASINTIRGTLIDLSDTVRKNVAQWCIRAENQTDFPWNSLFAIVSGYPEDLSKLMTVSVQFREYADRLMNGRVMDLPDDNATGFAEIEPSDSASIESRVDQNVSVIRGNAKPARQMYRSMTPPRLKSAGGDK